ncbi:hypothetical protein [Nocardioides sp. B-3]|uniref:hypothetical protein n=1 Tax=Nocardioides sp. B-3 TaxID=2895565 RepID=UPI0021530C3F|nr:hypothetical protein [Nocardioides sp. B-3]UUZ59917.1 hypothetical protein LP418_02400 [Nocardioides sp. B-3]
MPGSCMRSSRRLPDPEISPGYPGDDWIDRGGGFGTDVKVTAIDVVPGEYGNQLDIAFVLDLPDDVDVPLEGSLLLPLDAEWREVSGYTEPEDYAPRVAARLVRCIREHVRAHEPSRDSDRELPSRAEQHAMLLEVLGREGQVEEQAPNRYVVRRQQQEDLTVLVTPDQWERVIHRHGPAARVAHRALRRAVRLHPSGGALPRSSGTVTSRPRRGRSCLPPRSRSPATRRDRAPAVGGPGEWP